MSEKTPGTPTGAFSKSGFGPDGERTPCNPSRQWPLRAGLNPFPGHRTPGRIFET